MEPRSDIFVYINYSMSSDEPDNNDSFTDDNTELALFYNEVSKCYAKYLLLTTVSGCDAGSRRGRRRSIVYI